MDASSPPHTDEPLLAPTRRPTTVLLIAAGFYVVLVVGLALSGRFTFVWKTSVIPALFIVALATRQMRVFLYDWAVLLGAIVLFDSLRGLIFAVLTRLELRWYAAYVVDAEHALLGGTTLPEVLQAGGNGGQADALAKTLVLFHGSHFLFFLLFGLAVWLFRRAEFWRFRVSILLLLGMGLLTYQLVPTAPPWMASDLGLIGPIDRITLQIYNTASPNLARTFDVNPIAAMPSLHAALPALFVLIGLHHFRLRALVVVFYACMVWFGIGYLGEHYLVDILAGAGYAAVAYLLVYRGVLDRFTRADDPALTADRGHWPPVLKHRVLIGLVLVIAAEGVGQAAISLRAPMVIDRAFVTSELIGRSPLGHLHLARLATSEGNFEEAAAALAAGFAEISEPNHMLMALSALRSLSNAASDPQLERRLLDGLPPQAKILKEMTLASVQFSNGEARSAIDRLRRITDEHPQAAKPLYLLGTFGSESGLMSATQVEDIAARLDRLEDLDAQAASWAEDLRRMSSASGPGAAGKVPEVPTR